MRHILMVILAGLVLGTAIAAMQPLERRNGVAMLLGNYNIEPETTRSRIEASIEVCLHQPGRDPAFERKVRRLLAKLYLYTIELKSKEPDENIVRSRINAWVKENARGIVEEINEKDFSELLDSVRRSTDSSVVECILARSI